MEADISEQAGRYCKWMVPALAVNCQTDLQSQFLNCLQLSNGPFMAAAFVFPMHLLFLYSLVIRLSFGVVGIALANTLSSMLMLLFMLLFQHYFLEKEHPIHRIVGVPVSKETYGWKEMQSQLAFGLACSVPTFLRWVQFELMGVESAYLESYKSAAVTIGLQVESLTWGFSEGIKVAAVSLIGFEMGAGNIEKSKRLARLVMLQTLVFIVFCCSLLYFFTLELIQVYTQNTLIVQAFQNHALALLLLISGDLFLSALVGLVKALGKQVDLMLPSLVCCYFIALPTSYYFCFHTSLQASGLFFGTFIGYAIFCFWLAILICFKYDWQLISNSIQHKAI